MRLFFAIVFALFICAPVFAQDDNLFLERRAVNIAVRFHHISNGDRSGSNRGLNNFVIYAGFSIFK